MKKIAYILGIICAMTMQSCLDLEPKTQLADTNYWKSPSLQAVSLSTMHWA